MWLFKRTKKIKCSHRWVITEVFLSTDHHLAFKDTSRVSRSCSLCLTQEHHTVAGHIDYSTAYEIFGGREDENG